MLRLHLRYIFVIICLVLGTNGNPKPYYTDTSEESERGGFFDIFGALVDYFYDDDSDEDYQADKDTYLICRNCTVTISQTNNSQSSIGGANGGVTPSPPSPPAPPAPPAPTSAPTAAPATAATTAPSTAATTAPSTPAVLPPGN